MLRKDQTQGGMAGSKAYANLFDDDDLENEEEQSLDDELQVWWSTLLSELWLS